jgi:hypothetical protein
MWSNRNGRQGKCIEIVDIAHAKHAVRYVRAAATQERGDMDAIVIAIVLGFFAVSATLVGLLDRLSPGEVSEPC